MNLLFSLGIVILSVIIILSIPLLRRSLLVQPLFPYLKKSAPIYQQNRRSGFRSRRYVGGKKICFVESRIGKRYTRFNFIDINSRRTKFF